MVSAAEWLLFVRDAVQLMEAARPPDGVIRCLIYVRISLDDKHDEHGVANQMAKLERKANERGWTVVYRLSDNDIGVTRKDPTKPGKYRPGYEEAMRLVDARMVASRLMTRPTLHSSPWQRSAGQETLGDLAPSAADSAVAGLPSRPVPAAVNARKWVPADPETLRRVKSALDGLWEEHHGL